MLTLTARSHGFSLHMLALFHRRAGCQVIRLHALLVIVDVNLSHALMFGIAYSLLCHSKVLGDDSNPISPNSCSWNMATHPLARLGLINHHIDVQSPERRWSIVYPLCCLLFIGGRFFGRFHTFRDVLVGFFLDS
jgi:hypothetical protein